MGGCSENLRIKRGGNMQNVNLELLKEIVELISIMSQQ